MNFLSEEFERLSSEPIYWFNKSSDLRGSVAAIWFGMTKAGSNLVAKECHLSEGFSVSVAAWPVYKMLCGMSLELLYKAICVKKGIPFKHSHNLTYLASLAGVNVEEGDLGVLELLTEAIVWGGRYPVPKQEENFGKYRELHTEVLFEKTQRGSLTIHKPKHEQALGWQHFNQLWSVANEMYWRP